MTANLGTLVASKIVTPDDADTHATHDDVTQKGGWRTVATTAVRDAIPVPRRTVGMCVYVVADSTEYVLGADLTSWTAKTSSGHTIQTASGDNLPAESVLQFKGGNRAIAGTGKTIIDTGDAHLFDFVPVAEQIKMLSRTISLNDQMPYLQAAIDQVVAAGTEKHGLNVPPILLSAYTQGIIQNSGFRLVTSGGGSFHHGNSGVNYYENQSKRFLIQWEGGTGHGAVILVRTPIPVDLTELRQVSGVDVSNIAIRGLNQAADTLADVGIEFRNVCACIMENAWFGAFTETSIELAREYGLSVGVGPTGHENLASQKNFFRRIYLDQQHASAGHGIWVSDRGGADMHGGWWFCQIEGLWIGHNYGDAIKLQSSDTLLFKNVQCTCPAADRGYALSIHGSDRESYVAGFHVFENFSPGGGDYQGRVRIYGTEEYTYAANTKNTFVNYDRMNGARDIIVGTGCKEPYVSDSFANQKGCGVIAHAPVDHPTVIGDYTVQIGFAYTPDDYSAVDPARYMGKWMPYASNIQTLTLTGITNIIVQADDDYFTARLHINNPSCYALAIYCTYHDPAGIIDPGVTTIDVDATAKTFTRATGSFVTDGYYAGQVIQTSGFGASNTTKVIDTVAALVITVKNATGLTTETGTGAERIVGIPTAAIVWKSPAATLNSTSAIVDLNFADQVLTGSLNWSSRVFTSPSGSVFGDVIEISYAPTGNSSANVYGVQQIGKKTGDYDCSGGLVGAYNLFAMNGGGTYSSQENAGTYTYVQVNSVTANVTGAVAGVKTKPVNLLAGAVNAAIGVWIGGSTVAEGGTVVAEYGLIIDNINHGSTTNYAIYCAGGNSYHAGNWAVGGVISAVSYVENSVARSFIRNVISITADTTLTASQLKDDPVLNIGAAIATIPAADEGLAFDATWVGSSGAEVTAPTNNFRLPNNTTATTLTLATTYPKGFRAVAAGYPCEWHVHHLGPHSAADHADGVMVGPASVTTDTLVANDGTTGKLVKACTTTKTALDAFMVAIANDVSGSRTFTAGSTASSTYQNTHGHPMPISVNIVGTADAGRVKLVMGSTSSPTAEVVIGNWWETAAKKESSLTAVIPKDWYYKLTLGGAGNTLASVGVWREWY